MRAAADPASTFKSLVNIQCASLTVLLCQALQRCEDTYGTRPKPEDVILLGGGALCVGGIRHHEDLDFYCKDTNFSKALKIFERTWLSPRLGITIDITDSDLLWGEIRVPDLAEDALDYQLSKYNNKIKRASNETLFILKANSGREKDIRDLGLIATETTPEKIVKRLQVLAQYNEEEFGMDFMDRIVNTYSEMQFHYGPIRSDWLEGWDDVHFNELMCNYSDIIDASQEGAGIGVVF